MLYLSDIPDLGGGEVNLLALASGLDPARYRAALIAPGEGPFAAAARERGLAPVLLPLPRPRLHLGLVPWLSPTALGAVVKTARATGAAILHANSYDTAAYAALAAPLAGARSVWTCRGWAFRSHGLHGTFIARGLSRVVAISAWVKDKLVAPGKVDPGQVRVIPQGVPLERFSPGRLDAPARAALGLDPHLPVVGIVGTLYPLKGHARLFEAVAALAARGLAVQVLVVGEGSPPDSEAERQIRALPTRLGIDSRVVFAGRVRDPARLYQAMDLLAAPSEVESFGTAIVEAQAAGLPVVATRVGAPVETVRDGVTGFLEDPFAVARWADRIAALVSDQALRTRMGRAAAAWAREQFDLSRTLLAYQALYDEL